MSTKQGPRTHGCLLMKLRANTGATYDRRHREIPADLAAALLAAGIDENYIFRLNETVVILVHHPSDVGPALEHVTHSPAARRWSERFSELILESPEAMTEVWRLGSVARESSIEMADERCE